MTGKKEKIIILSIFILLIFVAGYRNFNKNNELEDYGEETNCIITEFRFVHKSSYKLIYKFSVNDKFYFGSADTSYFECEDGTKGCIGNTFEVTYSKKNPKINKINLNIYNKYNKNRIQL